MDEGQAFWAFISYSHKDARWASWLQRALERYPVPRRFVGHQTSVGPAPARLRPIFRDRGDLAADPNLKRSVTRALRDAGCLIVICSPAAAASPWVEDEIVQFKRLHGEARILPVIVAGEPNVSNQPGRESDECFPKALRRMLDAQGELGPDEIEPAAADVRPGGDGRRAALLKIVAGMLEVGLDDLIHRDAQRRVAQLTALAAGATAGVVVMGALTLLAVVERNEAQRRQAAAEDLIEFMLSDLTGKLEPYGRLDALDAVGRKALAYYADQTGLGSDAAARRARALQLMGDLSQRRGDVAGASRLFDQASRITADLLARHPDSPDRAFDHAQSVYWLGAIAESQNRLDEAASHFLDYQALADRLIVLDPQNPRSKGELAYADDDLGIVRLEQKRPDEASALFGAALTIETERAAQAPTDVDRKFDLAQGHAWLADADVAKGAFAAALKERLVERGIYAARLAAAPDDKRVAYSMAVNHKVVTRILEAQGKENGARAELAAAESIARQLIAAEPDNVRYRILENDLAEARASLR